MKMKTFLRNDINVLDKEASDFSAEHNGKFTQTDTIVFKDELIHKVVIFYED